MKNFRPNFINILLRNKNHLTTSHPTAMVSFIQARNKHRGPEAFIKIVPEMVQFPCIFLFGYATNKRNGSLPTHFLKSFDLKQDNKAADIQGDTENERYKEDNKIT